jgi:hypothetical protein
LSLFVDPRWVDIACISVGAVRRELSDAAGHDFFLPLQLFDPEWCENSGYHLPIIEPGQPASTAQCTKPMASVFSTHIFRAQLDSLTTNP